MYTSSAKPIASGTKPSETLFTTMLAPKVVKIIEIMPTIGQFDGAGTK